MSAAQRRNSRSVSAERRFWNRVAEVHGCWLWTGATTGAGYGHLMVRGKHTPAHRFAYELLIGPIPDGLQIDHLCRNRGCVHPSHLEPVTCRENLLRAPTFQAANAAKTHCLKGHPFTPDNTRVALGRRHCRACGKDRTEQYRLQRVAAREASRAS